MVKMRSCRAYNRSLRRCLPSAPCTFSSYVRRSASVASSEAGMNLIHSDEEASTPPGILNLNFRGGNMSERSTHFSLLMEYLRKFFQFHPGLPSLSHAT